MTRKAIINGELVDYAHARLHISDLALQRGYGIFDFFLAYNNKPFLINAYLERLFNSAILINLGIGYSKDEIYSFILQLLETNNLGNSSIKIIITGGYSEDGYMPVKSNLIIINSPLLPENPLTYTKGEKLIELEYKREIPEAKTINYLQSLKLIQKMRELNAVDVLYYDSESVREASRCNFFIVKDKTVITPQNGILKGITRKSLLEMMTKNKIPIIERNIPIAELNDIDEAFVTNTSKRIMPIVEIGGRKIANGEVGEMTKVLMNLFDEELKRQTR
jgi:D-alanine transaminase/branched-chain amino acid aminotransferase